MLKFVSEGLLFPNIFMPHYVFILPPFTFWLPLEVCSSLWLSPHPLSNKIYYQRMKSNQILTSPRSLTFGGLAPSTAKGKDMLPAEGR